MLRDVAEGDVAVVGDRPDAQRRAIEPGVAVLVLSNDARPADELVALAEEHGTPVIATPLDSYVGGPHDHAVLAVPGAARDRPLTVRADDLVSDIPDDVKDVSYRAAVVVDGARRPDRARHARRSRRSRGRGA